MKYADRREEKSASAGMRERVIRNLVSYREIINSQETLYHNEINKKITIKTRETVKLERGLEFNQTLDTIS
jgi:hypothetical protein